LGVLGAKSRFQALTGQRSTVGHVIIGWNQGYDLESAGRGQPKRGREHPPGLLPGNRFVDVVGNDIYDIGFRPQWAANERLYRAHLSKPYAFPEWGLWGIDDPAFIRAMAKFVKGHRRVELLSWFNGQSSGGTFDIATKPRSRAAYRSLITPLGR